MAQEYLTASQVIFDELDSSADFVSESDRRWSEYYIKIGDIEQAFNCIHRSITVAIEKEFRLEEGISRRVLGVIYLICNELERAETALQKSLQILTDLNSIYEAAKTKLSLARFYFQTASIEEAQAYLHEATQTFEQLGAQADLAEARALVQQYILSYQSTSGFGNT